MGWTQFLQAHFSEIFPVVTALAGSCLVPLTTAMVEWWKARGARHREADNARRLRHEEFLATPLQANIEMHLKLLDQISLWCLNGKELTAFRDMDVLEAMGHQESYIKARIFAFGDSELMQQYELFRNYFGGCRQFLLDKNQNASIKEKTSAQKVAAVIMKHTWT